MEKLTRIGMIWPLKKLSVVYENSMDRKKNLLIVVAGGYGHVAKEIAESMNCFEKICFFR